MKKKCNLRGRDAKGSIFYAFESQAWKRVSHCVCVLRNHSFNVKKYRFYSIGYDEYVARHGVN